jgi:enoyl-CoA hydratase
MSTGKIVWEVDDGVGLATIDRPERRNALTAALCDELRGHLAAAHDLRAVVITGAGSAFCAGADLSARFEGESSEDVFRPAFERLVGEMVSLPAPVIAAVNGPALGGGTQLAVACDLRVVSPAAAFSIPATHLGAMISPENIARLVSIVGQAHARDLLLTGRRIGVEEAQRMNLVHRLADDALGAALALAAEIATLAPLTVAGHKAALNAVAAAAAPARGRDDDVLAGLDALVVGAFASQDIREGLAAFAEKRRPRFTGK